MSEFKVRQNSRDRRKSKVRSRVSGTSTKPRLTIKVSNSNVYAQLVNDENGTTIVSSNSIKAGKAAGTSLSDKSAWVGEDIAKKAKTAKVKEVVFDRGHKAYHGRVKTLADAARKNGLEF